MNTRSAKGLMVLLIVVLMGSVSEAQSWTQNKYCPGWNNPSNFTDGNMTSSSAVPGIGYYSGQGGNIGSNKPCPNPLSGETGVNWTTVYTAAQLANVSSGGCSNSIPSVGNQFVIMTNTTGHDPNTNNQLPYVPTHFNTTDTGDVINTNLTKSIRIGDGCKNGSSNSGEYGAAALYYTMRPTSQNAMIYLYYAIVAESPTHGVQGNPTLIIRVMRQNGSSWQQISDTLAYYISSATTNNASPTCPNMNAVSTAPTGQQGWHSSGSVLYKDWAKVAINLNDYLYENIQIQVMINDCLYNAHYAYAYIAGECRPMLLTTAGCPVGRSTNVATISAPRGMMNYEWRASNYGVSEPITDLTDANSHFSFRTLASGTEAQGMHVYNVQAADFHITRRTRTSGGHDSVMVDSTGMDQTFECKMTSALDPAKPFQSSLYVNVSNIKPTVSIDSLSTCDGKVLLTNYSYIPGSSVGVNRDSTRYMFYNNAACGGSPVATIIGGDTASHVYEDADVKGAVVRVYHRDSTFCWTEKQFSIKPRKSPNAIMSLSRHVLCDADETTMTDSTADTYFRRWKFLKADSEFGPNAEYDSIEGFYNENREITRGFTHDVEPIMLMVQNGQFYRNPENVSQTIWCADTAYDTVAVFLHPNLEVTGDTIVCVGSPTNANVNAIGVSNCTYQWSRTMGVITGGIPEGSLLAVMPYADTSIYYVRVTTQEGCVAWDSIHAYLVRPTLTMLPADGRICPGDEAILTGGAADHYTWTASPGDASLAGQDSADEIHVRPTQTTVYTMVGHGTNDCDASPLTKTVTIVPLPTPRITTDPNFVDADNPTITLRDVSPNGVRSEWLFYGGETENTREVQHTFDEAIGRDSVHVQLTAYNVLDCPKEKIFGIPVLIYTAWFPNIFTPGSEDENAKFRLYTLTEYEFFHIYIYNRGGQLVFESVDPNFEWDGTYRDEPCPQGSYVYVCNYRKNGTSTLMTKNGTITLIR